VRIVCLLRECMCTYCIFVVLYVTVYCVSAHHMHMNLL